jgi:hypothetical protein
MFVSPTDIATLTGYKRQASQIAWLRAHGWVFEIGADGRPKVLQSYAERRLGGVDSRPREPKLRLPGTRQSA